VYKPAVIRETDIIPPGKEIRFSHQITNNDGLLGMHIARSKKISYDDAFKRIERATSKIIYQLDKGEKVAFGDLGEFSYNENGEIQFTMFVNAEPVLPAGFEPVSLEDITEIQEEVPVEQVVVPEPVADSETESVIAETVAEQELPAAKETIQEEQKETIQSITEPEVVQQPVTEPENATAPEKKKSIFWIWILLAFVAVVIIVFFLQTKNKQASTNTESESQDIKVEVIQPETVHRDTIQPADTVPATVVQQQVISSSSPKFYLVGGGFKSEENAVKFINRLKEKGIEGTLLGQRGTIYLVGIASYNTEEEAFAELNRRTRENPEWKLWVYSK
jgi:hypothetical protein